MLKETSILLCLLDSPIYVLKLLWREPKTHGQESFDFAFFNQCSQPRASSLKADSRGPFLRGVLPGRKVTKARHSFSPQIEIFQSNSEKIEETVDRRGRGHTFARKNSIYQIGTYQCVSYLRGYDNFIINLGLYLASYLWNIFIFILKVLLVTH